MFAVKSILFTTVAILGLQLVLSAPIEDQQPVCLLNPEFEQIKLSTQWQPGVCQAAEQPCSVSPRAVFSIAGLRPDDVIDCCGQAYDATLLQPLSSELEHFWPLLTGDKSSYADEWKKHGSCGLTVPQLDNQSKYFRTALDLFKSLHLAEALASANIKPDSRSSVQYDYLIEVLKPYLNNKTPQVVCKETDDLEYPLLTGIDVCYSKNLEVVDCEPSWYKCTRRLVLADDGSQAQVQAFQAQFDNDSEFPSLQTKSTIPHQPSPVFGSYKTALIGARA